MREGPQAQPLARTSSAADSRGHGRIPAWCVRGQAGAGTGQGGARGESMRRRCSCVAMQATQDAGHARFCHRTPGQPLLPLPQTGSQRWQMPRHTSRLSSACNPTPPLGYSRPSHPPTTPGSCHRPAPRCTRHPTPAPPHPESLRPAAWARPAPASGRRGCTSRCGRCCWSWAPRTGRGSRPAPPAARCQA